jgi:hypothetical protein
MTELRISCHHDIAPKIMARVAENLNGKFHTSKRNVPMAVFTVGGVQMSACWFNSNRDRGRKIVVRYPWPSEYQGKDVRGQTIWSKQDGFAVQCDFRNITTRDCGPFIDEKCKEILNMASEIVSGEADRAEVIIKDKRCPNQHELLVRFKPNVLEGTGHMFVEWVCPVCFHQEDMTKSEFDLLKGTKE